MGSYLPLFRNKPFLFFWLGFTVTVIGDAITRIALVWHVYSETGSPEAVGFLNFLYIAPVIVGGFLAGWLLDRFDKKKVLIIDSVAKAIVVAMIPLLDAFGIFELWHAFAVAAIYGLLMMVPLAGVPALIPTLVASDHLRPANSLEVVSFTMGGVIGAPIAGILIAAFGAANVLLIDAATYLLFALSLSVIKAAPVARGHPTGQAGAQGFGAAFRLFRDNAVLRSTTLMFLAANLGLGALLVWLPIFAGGGEDGGVEYYGLLMGILAAGEVVGSIIAGAAALALPLGLMICLSQTLSGASLSLLLVGDHPAFAAVAIFLFGVFAAPMTIWAQTLRMQIIPAEQRGRVFALLRMMMQSGTPLGGLAAGFALPLVGAAAVMTGAISAISSSGLAGMFCRALRIAGAPGRSWAGGDVPPN